ncbi:hypothetical protein BOTBODRAFT_39623 [Botryobasidium botryosum FD-172 SS1]|uniref:Uncharacterized protein n=1 Tax=Botryobasidium botryosum (strain FD-172 SS1) TaxID=930990 RepID=A0A067LT21_BOTB1|nr:hypothetical protein BOTBODRAFT_39623 [Botryobasidium botryosum FD-172 SS1]
MELQETLQAYATTLLLPLLYLNSRIVIAVAESSPSLDFQRFSCWLKPCCTFSLERISVEELFVSHFGLSVLSVGVVDGTSLKAIPPWTRREPFQAQRCVSQVADGPLSSHGLPTFDKATWPSHGMLFQHNLRFSPQEQPSQGFCPMYISGNENQSNPIIMDHLIESLWRILRPCLPLADYDITPPKKQDFLLYFYLSNG